MRSFHALVEFVISRDMGLSKSKVRTLNFRRANFQLFAELVDEIPWDTVLTDRGSDQRSQLFKDIFLGVQELSIPICHKSSREGRKLARSNKDLLVKLRQKEEMHRGGKRPLDLATWSKSILGSKLSKLISRALN